MLSIVNVEDQLICARLVDFLAGSSPWHRCLWNPGLSLGLNEVLESADAARAGVLSDESVKLLCGSLIRISALDPGAGNERQLQTLQQALRVPPKFDGFEYNVLRQLAEEIKAEYLGRWYRFLSDRGKRPSVERAARSICSYLLDLGFNPGYLHRWWTFRLKHDAASRSLAEIVQEADSLAKQPLRTFEVLTLFGSIPRTNSGNPQQWLNYSEVVSWMEKHSFGVSPHRPSGGVIRFIKARDPESAAELAGEFIANLASRVTVGTGGTLRVIPFVWIADQPQPFELSSRLRGVRVRALYREDHIFPLGEKSVIDPAIELISHLETSSPTAAIAGGWAAIEALLSDPGDRSVAAERLANLVACSYPRAELTFLSYALKKSDPDMYLTLKSLPENRDRCLATATAIQTGRKLLFSTISDQAALNRIEKLLNSPRKVLFDLKTYVHDAFARLYRQRNLILHGGRTDSVALRAALRTAAPLVGAGMDRLAHGLYVLKMRPIEVAARARIALNAIEDGDVKSCVDLLG